MSDTDVYQQVPLRIRNAPGLPGLD